MMEIDKEVGDQEMMAQFSKWGQAGYRVVVLKYLLKLTRGRKIRTFRSISRIQ